VLSSNDSVAQGISNALKTAGYTADNFPVITGMDCDKGSFKFTSQKGTAMFTKIIEKLAEIEHDHMCVIHAVESGSRAWG
jgi:ABC-type xylose transport system substrate-binding protein